ncbi:MAG: hypothetical protein AB2764_19790, partial [Candidatus Thiodiazotropha endolucinida]
SAERNGKIYCTEAYDIQIKKFKKEIISIAPPISVLLNEKVLGKIEIQCVQSIMAFSVVLARSVHLRF